MYSSPYVPAAPPQNLEGIPVYLHRELVRIAGVLSNISDNIYEETHVAPDKPQNGQVVYADGTDWNPGSGRGLYFYKGSTWTFIV
jgi:hypothetical protein